MFEVMIVALSFNALLASTEAMCRRCTKASPTTNVTQHTGLLLDRSPSATGFLAQWQVLYDIVTDKFPLKDSIEFRGAA